MVTQVEGEQTTRGARHRRRRARPLWTVLVPVVTAGAGLMFAMSFQAAQGSDLRADRDFPPFDRVAMDGIAVAHAAWAGGQSSFVLAHTQYAGAPAHPLLDPATAAEVMTGAVLPPGTDTVIRYEDLDLSAGRASIRIPPPAGPGQHVHPRA